MKAKPQTDQARQSPARPTAPSQPPYAPAACKAGLPSRGRTAGGENSALGPEARQAILDRIEKIAIFGTLGMEVLEMGDGTCTVRIPRQRRHDGIFDTLHGGILATLADSVAAFAILTKTGAQAAMATTDLNIRFLAPCLSGVTAAAKLIKKGRTMCPVNVELFDEQGALVAVAQVNYLLMDKASA